MLKSGKAIELKTFGVKYNKHYFSIWRRSLDSQEIIDFIRALKVDFQVPEEQIFLDPSSGWIFDVENTAFEVQQFPDREELIHKNGSLLAVAIKTLDDEVKLDSSLLLEITLEAPTLLSLNRVESWQTPIQEKYRTPQENDEHYQAKLTGRLKKWLQTYARIRKNEPEYNAVIKTFSRDEKLLAADALFRGKPLSKYQVAILNNGRQKVQLMKIGREVYQHSFSQSLDFLLRKRGYTLSTIAENKGGYTIFSSIFEDSFFALSPRQPFNLNHLRSPNDPIRQLDELRIDSSESLSSQIIDSPNNIFNLTTHVFTEYSPDQSIETMSDDDESSAGYSSHPPSPSQTKPTNQSSRYLPEFISRFFPSSISESQQEVMDLADKALLTSFCSSHSSIQFDENEDHIPFIDIEKEKLAFNGELKDDYSDIVDEIIRWILSTISPAFESLDGKRKNDLVLQCQEPAGFISTSTKRLKKRYESLLEHLESQYEQLNGNATLETKKTFFSIIHANLLDLITVSIRLFMLGEIGLEDLQSTQNAFTTFKSSAQKIGFSASKDIIPDLENIFLWRKQDLLLIWTHEQQATTSCIVKKSKTASIHNAYRQRIRAIELYLNMHEKRLEYFPENKILKQKITDLIKERTSLIEKLPNSVISKKKTYAYNSSMWQSITITLPQNQDEKASTRQAILHGKS